MATYNFLTIWKFNAPLEEVYAAIHDADNYHLWWKGQSKVESIQKGDALGIGAVKKFRTKSFLPYTLTYTGTVREVVPLKKVVGTTVGELEGTGTWIFEYNNGITTVKYYWQVKTNSRLMNFFTPVLKPLFAWNHDVVMRWGGEGLAKYLKCDLVS
ncbi:MAG: SRPBCC family protein [Chitinophagales bacterium]|nr:SRPBCC family protein [Chitinophagales bacterium]